MKIAIPVHKTLSKEDMDLFNRCLESVNSNNGDYLVVCTPESQKQFKGLKKNFIVVNEGEADYPGMVNFIANTVQDEFVMVLEFDDVLTNGALERFREHTKAYPQVDMFVPIVHETTPDGHFLALKNNIAWSYGQMPQMGFFSLEEIKRSLDFSVVGAVYRTSALKNTPYKRCLTIYNEKEYLLRWLNKGHLSYVVPMVGIKHTQLRKGSYFDQELQKTTKVERKFLVQAVKREYFFDEDREIN